MNAVEAVQQAWQAQLRSPFDMARQQYAAAVRAGALPNSPIQAARTERMLHSMEVLSLGSMARQR